ncbi:MAG: helix-turn-helix domain-containing protein [Tannerellaceae bacterium]|jgi:transcriptional regulator with XRE-family HTH domain|nr:helix-turn-helix domain-containing protein [Tannerellaceae bacterium]
MKKIKLKLKQARIARHKTQHYMANQLCINQSQYQRRETGLIFITDKEWMRIAKVLEVEVDEIRENDSVSTTYNYDNHSGDHSASNNHFCNIHDYIMKNQQEYIDMLKNKNSELQEKNKLLEHTIRQLQDELQQIKVRDE